MTSGATGPALEVPALLDGERIDRAIALLTGRARTEVAALISQGQVRVDGRVVLVRHRRVATGEALDLGLAEVEAAVTPLANDAVPFGVVYEDDAVIVVDKPAGVVVHPGAGHRDDTLVSGLLARYPDLAEAALAGAGESLRPGIVHRLDKETSGLLVVARTPTAYRSLTAQLAERTMGRTYQALAKGSVQADEGIIEAPIGRSVRDPTKMAVRTAGREARTRYHVVGRYRSPFPVTLLGVVLDTGRTHQIRVHLAAIGHPVAGDSRYGGALRAIGVTRPFLHAEALRFAHPVSGEELSFVSPLPGDLAAVLARLEV